MTTALCQWAAQWRVPLEAIQDLQYRLGLDAPPDATSTPGTGRSEAWVQSAVRLEASKLGWRLFRNNVGAFQDSTGRWVRYGLANDSAALNKKLKSGDLVGIKPVVVTPEMVGQKLGVFVSREVKQEGWRYTGTEREVAQLAWINLVNSLGGDAAFTTGNLTPPSKP